MEVTLPKLPESTALPGTVSSNQKFLQILDMPLLLPGGYYDLMTLAFQIQKSEIKLTMFSSFPTQSSCLSSYHSPRNESQNYRQALRPKSPHCPLVYCNYPLIILLDSCLASLPTISNGTRVAFLK